MIKKILFLLTFLLTTLGGGNSAWAEEYVINSSNISLYSDVPNGTKVDYTYTISTGSGLTLKYTREAEKYLSGGKEYCIKYSNGYVYSVSGIPNTEVITSIAFYGYSNNSGKTSTLYLNNVCTDKTFSESATGYTLSDLSLVGGFSFKADGAETGLKITITTDDRTIDNIYSGTYPYTWDFHVPAEQWTKSKKLLTNSPSWFNNGEEARFGATSAPANNGIDIIKGLAFSDVTAATSNSGEGFTNGTLCLDWTHQWLWMNGKVTIPSLKVGQKVIFTSEYDVTYFSGAGNVDVSSGREFNITSSGDVTFTVSGGVWSIAVVKNDLTDFSFDLGQTYYGKSNPPSGKIAGAFIGRTNTFKYKLGRDQILRTTMRVDPDAQTLVGRSLAVNVNIPEFTKSSSNESVLGTSGTACRSAANKVTYWDIPVNGCGTTNLTYSFAGSDAYNAEDYTELFTIEKDDIDLKFDEDFVVKTPGVDGPFTNTFTLNGLTLPVTDDNAGTIDTSSFTYQVTTADNKNISDLVSVDGNGQVTLSSTPGVVNIHVKHDETNWYNEVDRSYRLVVNPSSGTTPTLQWSDDVSGGVSVSYNDAVLHTATGSIGEGQTIKYRSADTSVASVDADGRVTGTGLGSTTIYAYVEPTSTHNYAEIHYSVTVTSAEELKSFKFIPNNGKVNNGKSITPKLAFPTIPASGVTSLKVTKIQVLERNGGQVTDAALTEDNDIAACDIISIDEASDLTKNWVLNADGKVNKVNVTIKGKTIGKAEITVTFQSSYFNKEATATYTVVVTDASTRNFSWADSSGSPEYYTYAGDFMMLPAISGNSNGNNNYSNGAKNSASYSEGGTSYSALQKYKYDIKNGTITWNKKDIKIGEGFPDFEIVTDGSSAGTASVFFGRGEGGNHPDTLMVFCETAGDVKLRAYDPQDHNKYCDAIIHILPISNIEGTNAPATTVTSSMTYPYTWDFTTNFDMSVVGETDRYWTPIKDNSGDPTGDYTNGYGFFNLDWADTNTNGKTDDRFYKYFIAGAGSSATGYMHEFNGMMLKLKGSTSWANKMDRMRILAYDNTNQKGRLQFNGGPHYMKLYLPVADNRPSSFKIFVKAEGSGSVNINETEDTKQVLSETAKIYSFDSSNITTTGDNCVILGFEDARVYWIAMSTEAKSITQPEDMPCPAATYCYAKDLDFSLSQEANTCDIADNELTAWYASGFNDETKTVTMSKLTTPVATSQGVFLKAANGKKGNYYMIGKAENSKTPATATTMSDNLLQPLLTSAPVTRFVKDKDDIITHTNFFLNYHYLEYDNHNIDGDPVGGYIDPGYWRFYRIHNSVTGKEKTAYLQVPGEQKEIGSNPAASRAQGSMDVSGAMVYIVFEGEPDISEVTGISSVTDNIIDNEAWYTLQGVRVNAPTKGGIYIHNGRKLVVK